MTIPVRTRSDSPESAIISRSMKPLREMFHPARSIRARIGLAVGGFALIAALLLSGFIGNRTADQLHDDKGAVMARLAYRMIMALDQDVGDHLGQIGALALQDGIRNAAPGNADKRLLVEMLQRMEGEFAWVGITDANGIVVAGTGGLLEGKDVSQRDYFIQGRKAPFVGDVHDAFLLAKLLPPPSDGLPLRFVDVAAPITDKEGRFQGVVVGHLSWEWASLSRENLFRVMKDASAFDLVLLNRENKVLLGDSRLVALNQRLDTPSTRAVAGNANGFLVETWLDGSSVLTGYAQSRGAKDYPGLGWRVLVRQNAERAFADARMVRNFIFVAGGLSALLFGVAVWFLLGRLIEPMARMSSVARRIRAGDKAIRIPVVAGCDEVAELSQSLRALIDDVTAKDGELEALNASLEMKVAERTAELSVKAQAIDQVNGALIVTDWDGFVTGWSKGGEEIYGYAAADIAGKHVALLHPSALLEFVRGQIIAPLKQHGAYEGDVVTLRKNGETFYSHLSLSLLHDETGKPVGMIGYATDVSERVRMEEALRQTAEDLKQAAEAAEAANRAKSEFLATMSHEIRTPMNGILGMTELALDSDLTADQREYLSLAKISAESLLTIINDILDFSKIEAGRLELEKVPFDLRHGLDAHIRNLAFRARKKGLSLSCEFAENVPHQLLGDPVRLNQIVINLVGNAIKFTEQGGITVRVAAETLDQHAALLHFSVADSGIGIPADKLASIFDSFSQVDASVTRKYGGTGLGLAICKRLVDLMGGEIWVKSQPGKGSIFHFTASLAPAASAAAAPLAALPATEMVGQAPLEVLLVEDNPINQKLALALLEKWGHRVTIANNGVEALAYVGGGHFDLILMDWQMPEMDGIEATRQIREMEKASSGHVTIVAMTANALQGDRERCLAAGMDGYIAKPIQTGELLTVLGGKAAIPPIPQPQPAAAKDFDYAAALASAEREVLDVLTEMFLEQYPASLAEIADAIAAADYLKLERSAHALKGLLGYFRAVPAQQAARELEELGSQSRTNAGAEPLARLRAEIEKLRPHLEAYVMPH